MSGPESVQDVLLRVLHLVEHSVRRPREFDDALDNPGLPALFERIRDEVLARDA